MTFEEIHNRRIAELVEGFGEAFVAFDFEWRVVQCNQAAEAHFGVRREDALGKVIWDLIPGRGSPLYAFLSEAMTTRASGEVEIGSDVRPGHRLNMRAFPLETGLGVSFRDITEHRERVRREREQAERLELALAAAGFGDWSWDTATDIVTFSERAAIICGVPPGPLMTFTQMQHLLHPDDRERTRQEVKQAINRHTSYEIEFRFQRQVDGEERWVMIRGRGQYAEDGEALGMIGVLADISRLKADEARANADRERLAQLEQRRAFLLEASDTLRDLDQPDDILAAAARLLGQRLGVARVGYAEVSPDNGALVVASDWAWEGLPSLAGQARSSTAFGTGILAELTAGHTVTVADVRSDPRCEAFRDGYAAIGLQASVTVPLIRNGRFDAALFAHESQPRAWSAEDISIAEEIASRTWSSLARARFERALRESEARFRAMADSAPAPIWVTSAAGYVEFVNRAFCTAVGRPQDELVGEAWRALMHPEDIATVAAARAEGRRKLVLYEWTARFRRHDGEWRWMHATCQPRFDALGTFQGYVGLAVDVTDTRRAEERQSLLINELNHRVKNTLATVQSLAHQTLREGVVTREARNRLTDRLLALSAAHNVLTRRNWEAAEVAEISGEAVRPYDDPARPRVRLLGPAVRVPPNVALALSMALHELATNAVKYGALSGAEGAVTVTWTLTEGFIDLKWREEGGPPVVEPVERGFGSRLLREGLVAEFGAPAQMLFEPTGLVCRLRVATID